MKSSPEASWFPPDLEERGSRPNPAPIGPDGAWELPELADSAPPRRGRAGGVGTRGAQILSIEQSESETDRAYQRGHADGTKEGAAAVQQSIGTAVTALRHAADALANARRELPRTMSSDLHALAVAVAAKIIQREVKADAEIVKGLVERALELIPLDSPIEIRLHPDDLIEVQDALERLAAGEDGARTMKCVADPSIDRGGFIAEGPQRILDGRLDVALRTILERFEAE